MYYQLHYLNFSIGEVPKPSYMSILTDTIVGFNLVNLDYHQSVEELHINLVLKFTYLEDLENLDPLNISGVDGGKETEQGKVGIDVTAVFTYKNTFIVNAQPETVYLALG